jgi:hypothetical protein
MSRLALQPSVASHTLGPHADPLGDSVKCRSRDRPVQLSCTWCATVLRPMPLRERSSSGPPVPGRSPFLMSDNTALARLVLTSAKWILQGFNDTSHLPS